MRKLLVFWLVLVASLSLAPFGIKEVLGTRGPFHNFGHFLVFLVTGAMVLIDAPARKSRIRRFAFVILFSAATEGLESVVYSNIFEWRDFLIDCTAIAVSPLVLLARRFVVGR
jgi:hypothetical protein